MGDVYLSDYLKDRPNLMAKLSVDYPNINNHNLPKLLGCVTSHEESEAKLAFKRICFREVKISSVEAIRRNQNPSCIWEVHYHLKDPTELDEDSDSSLNSSGPVLSKLPDDQRSLSNLYKNITAMTDDLEMKVMRTYHMENRYHAVVEYAPRSCRCPFQDFSPAAKEPRMRRDVAEVELNLYCMQLT